MNSTNSHRPIKILVLDDDDAVRRTITNLLVEEGHTVLGIGSILQAREALERDHFDLVLSDLVLRDGSGLDFLRSIRRTHPKTQGMLMTGYASMESALEAIHLGIFDYLVKPVNPSQLNLSLQRFAAYLQLQSDEGKPEEETAPGLDMDLPVWGHSLAMRAVREMVEKAGPTQATVLIQGESGTGKEVIAQALYNSSTRLGKPFIKINCAAVPETLLESEFFGHEKGAFTGAINRREGRFEMANNGTLLLDEITEIPPALQVKLLRVLQEQEFERVGGNKTIKVDVRIIATTNRQLSEEVRRGRFREDLFYRLNVFPMVIAPLRERIEDLDGMTNHFLAKMTRKHGKNIPGVSAAAREKLRVYTWPGNIRELQNVIERAVIVAVPGQTLDAEALALPAFAPWSPPLFEQGPLPTMDEMEKRLIGLMLRQTGNNKSLASKKLGISVRTLRNKLNTYKAAGLDVTTPEGILGEKG